MKKNPKKSGKKKSKFPENAWFNVKPEKVENPKEFIISAIRQHQRSNPGEGGSEVGEYIAGIKNEETRGKFVKALKELKFADADSPDIEDWVKEELGIAYAVWRYKDEPGRKKEEDNEW